ncbi:FtsX-like permease family protein [Nocardioides sp. GXZ039]|uniref:FtsX-like permease family protein n=1 Tax=Nocardioides sp. GXZ039 TaxID=3136018 RepID=UPI0030F40E04
MSARTAGLALRSLRYRPTASAATFLAVLLGTALTGSFAALAATAGGTGVSATDAETLMIMGAVVGGWGTLIVLFSVASTVGITVRQRAVEIGLLRTVGASPRQARRLVRFEALAVALVAAIVGAGLATIGGRALLALVRGGLVSESVSYAGGFAPLAAAFGVVVVSGIAATAAGRRATQGPARFVVAEARSETVRLGRWRRIAAALLLAYGVGTAVVTITVSAHSDDPYAPMQTSGASAILVGLGLALLAPLLLRWGAMVTRPLLGRGAPAHLGSWNARRRSHRLAGVLGPVIVLAAAAIGVLMLVGIDGRTLAASYDPAGARTVTLLNNVVVGMIVLFAAIMVVNAIVAGISEREPEFARLRLAGATPAQIRATVRVEATVVGVVGVVLGALASTATVVPFAWARGEGVLPDAQLWLPPAVAVAVLVLTLVSSRVAVDRVTHASGRSVRAGAR